MIKGYSIYDPTIQKLLFNHNVILMKIQLFWGRLINVTNNLDADNLIDI